MGGCKNNMQHIYNTVIPPHIYMERIQKTFSQIQIVFDMWSLIEIDLY